jgi:asparagine synthase (glutamine-hydrolysing)
MCAIAGVIYSPSIFHKRERQVRDTVRRMISIQRHRGPDGEGFYDSHGVSLGHCRLAVIDLSSNGHQPMRDSEGRCWITFNGEIYNYRELGDELRDLGFRFRSQSDTEVLLYAYKYWGHDCVYKLRGMYAFGIWDERTKSLFAARDRLGIKPFHYYLDRADGGSVLAFASEIKALHQFLTVPDINRELVREFLAWNLLDHTDETMLSQIRRLPPGHSLVYREESGIKLSCYWRLEVSNDLDAPPEQESQLVHQFRERFVNTVSIHLRSDVPVGSCLSGGLDSSSIVCVASEILRKQGAWREGWQNSYSACFEERHLDERPYIDAVTAATGCRTHLIFPTGNQLRDDFTKWLWYQEEPVGGFGSYVQYCVTREAREHGAKVLLDGQGADEQLAGYRKFILVYLYNLMKERRYAKAIKEACTFFSSPDILRTSLLADGCRYFARTTDELDALWPGELRPNHPHCLGLAERLGNRIASDLTRFSLPILLRYEDRNTMAFGIESRVPFLDHIFVEWLATLPVSMRLGNGWTKRILRLALIGILPETVRRRKTKLGFVGPESKWLAGPMADWLIEMIRYPRHLSGVVDISGVHTLLERRMRGDNSLLLEYILFRLAIYESWARDVLSTERSSVFVS